MHGLQWDYSLTPRDSWCFPKVKCRRSLYSPWFHLIANITHRIEANDMTLGANKRWLGTRAEQAAAPSLFYASLALILSSYSFYSSSLNSFSIFKYLGNLVLSISAVSAYLFIFAVVLLCSCPKFSIQSSLVIQGLPPPTLPSTHLSKTWSAFLSSPVLLTKAYYFNWCSFTTLINFFFRLTSYLLFSSVQIFHSLSFKTLKKLALFSFLFPSLPHHFNWRSSTKVTLFSV